MHDNCPNSLNMPQPKRHFYSSRTNLASLLIETAISQFLSPKYRDKRVCLSVSVQKADAASWNFAEFLHALSMPWLGHPPNDAIRHVLPVFWMTSCFHVMAKHRRREYRRVF